MISDSINDEILRIKHELAAMHGNDVHRIAADARARQQNAVALPPRPVMPEPGDAPKLTTDAVSGGAASPTAG